MHYIQTQTINISIYVNKLLSASPLTLILSSLVKFDKGESKFEEKKCLCVCVWRGGGGEHTDTKTVCETVSVEVKYRNTQCRACGKLNISKSKNSNFELSTKCILIKNLKLIKKTRFKLIFFIFFFFYLFLIKFYSF